MSERKPTNQEVLERLGLSAHELKHVETEFNRFAKGLDHTQRLLLKRSTPTAQEAAATLGPHVSAEFLEEFIRAHSPEDATIMFFLKVDGTD